MSKTKSTSPVIHEHQEEPTVEKISVRDMFGVASDWINSLESSTWSRFNNFLTANSILALAWVAVFAAVQQPKTKPVLIALALTGLINCLLWMGLGYRHRRYFAEYLKVGKNLEEKFFLIAPATNKKEVELKGLFATQAEFSSKLRKKWWLPSTDTVLILIPLMLCILYAVFAWASFSS